VRRAALAIITSLTFSFGCFAYDMHMESLQSIVQDAVLSPCRGIGVDGRAAGRIVAFVLGGDTLYPVALQTMAEELREQALLDICSFETCKCIGHHSGFFAKWREAAWKAFAAVSGQEETDLDRTISRYQQCLLITR